MKGFRVQGSGWGVDFGPDFDQLLTATAADPAQPGDKCAGARNSRLHPRRRSGGQTPGIKNYWLSMTFRRSLSLLLFTGLEQGKLPGMLANPKPLEKSGFGLLMV